MAHILKGIISSGISGHLAIPGQVLVVAGGGAGGSILAVVRGIFGGR